MPFLAPIFVGTAATGGTAATAGLIGTGGAVTAGGLATGVATAAAVGGTYMSVQSSSQQAKAQSAMLNYNAKIDEQNAELKRREGMDRASEIRDRTRRLVGSQRTGYAKAGVTREGTPLLMELETQEMGELDAMMTQYNAQVGAQQHLSQAKYNRMGASSAKRTGRLKAGQSLFSGAGQIAGLYV